MSKKSLNAAEGRKMFEQLKDPAQIPVNFIYDGKEYQSFASFPRIEEKPDGSKYTAKFLIDENMEAELDALFCEEFGEVEYKIWFRNTGKAPTKCISSLWAYKEKIQGENPVLRGCLGDHDNDYMPYEYDLRKFPVHFKNDSSFATHKVFPYFDLVHGDGGTLMAIGWAGMWEGVFMEPLPGKGIHVSLRTTYYLHTILLPGEEIRTGLIVRIPYKGRNADDAANLWREWWIKYNMPRANTNGDPVKPFSTFIFASDTGLPNSDGSISESSTTWKPTLDKLIKEDIVPDFRWFDAGWYSDPAGNTVKSDWFGTVGSWEVDKVKWPGNSLRESNEACHKAGIKVLTWFEPEHTTHVPDLVKNYGYKAEWSRANSNNLANDECLEWTLKRITDMMEKNAVDLYREDCNCSSNGLWGSIESEESEKYGQPRYGLAENKGILAHYKLWDKILDYCAKHGKCTFLDSCASGGGRNDLESLRRGIPFMRSDYDRDELSVRLAMTTSFCKWIPFHGSSTQEKKKGSALLPGTGKGSDSFASRASFLPLYLMSDAVSHNKELDFNQLRKNLKEWRSINHLLYRDMYVLTKWHSEFDIYGWTSIAYDAPDLGESLLLAFRQEKCELDSFTAKLPFAEDGKTYLLKNEDTGAGIKMSGADLREIGITVKLDKPRSSAMYRIFVQK